MTWLKWILVLTCTARAETIDGALGLSSTSVVSTSYRSSSSSSVDLRLRYTHPMVGRWSLAGAYRMTTDSVLSGIEGGLSFDSRSFRVHSTKVNLEGQPEIVQAPNWMWRAQIGLGVYRYSQTLLSTDTSLGNRNRIKVQAELYGFSFGASCLKFFNERYGIFGEFNQVIASAKNFGITSTTFAVGGIWYFD